MSRKKNLLKSGFINASFKLKTIENQEHQKIKKSNRVKSETGEKSLVAHICAFSNDLKINVHRIWYNFGLGCTLLALWRIWLLNSQNSCDAPS